METQFTPGVWNWMDLSELVDSGVSASDGSAYGFNYRKGTDRNVILYLHGGGVAVNEHMAARPFYKDGDLEDMYYYPLPWHYGEELSHFGIMSSEENNPFHTWTIITVSCCTADFHCGTMTYTYTDKDGKPATICFHGFNNLQAVLARACALLDFEPERLLLCGGSAGGFGVSMLADYILNHFPKAQETVVCVDSAVMPLSNWRHTFGDFWKAPREIVDLIHSDNFTKDGLEALYQKRGDAVTIAYTGSPRDAMLAGYMGYETYGRLHATAELGQKYETELKKMLTALPFVKTFIYDLPIKNELRELGLTKHCCLLDKEASHYQNAEGQTLVEWLSSLFN